MSHQYEFSKNHTYGGTKLQKTLFFCDKCEKEVPIIKNGTTRPALYPFFINNGREHKSMDKYGHGFELCNECSELFSMVIADFCKTNHEVAKYKTKSVLDTLGAEKIVQ